MAKKIRFPLEMENGVEVRDIDSLRENFSMQRVMGYLADGKLITWLRDRYVNDMADAIQLLDKNDEELAKSICDILGVEYNDETEENIEKAKERNEKLARLKEITSENEYIDNIDNVAFDQDDLYDLLDEEADKIYLCGERFSIPLTQEGITYIGINNPVVVIDSKVEVDWEEKKIALLGIIYDEKYQGVMDSVAGIKLKLYQKAVENVKEQNVRRTKLSIGSYKANSYINFMLTPKDKKESEKYFDLLAAEIGDVKYDIDMDIMDAKQMLTNAKIVNLAENYINSL